MSPLRHNPTVFPAPPDERIFVNQTCLLPFPAKSIMLLIGDEVSEILRGEAVMSKDYTICVGTVGSGI